MKLPAEHQFDDCRAGAFCTLKGMDLPDLWRVIHLNARLADRASALMTGTDATGPSKELHEAWLSHRNELGSVPSERWQGLCTSAGWTAYGAAALSWCQNATLAQVIDGWRESGSPLTPCKQHERPAGFINPALLPQSRSLSVLVDAAKPDVFALCTMIAHSEDPLEFDISQQAFEKMGHPQLAAFLKSRMLQKPNRTANEDALILRWSQVVKGSEFDVWEEK